MGFLGAEFALKDGRQCTGVDLLYSPGGGFKDEEIRKWSRPDEPELFDVPGNLALVETFITKIIEIAENEADAKPPGKHRFILRTHQHLGGRATMSFSMSPSFRGGGDETALALPGGGRGDQAVMAQFASQAMRINAGMFDGTLRVLGAQNNDLRTENASLRTENFQLRREIEESRGNREDRQFQLAMAAAKNERQDEVFKRLMEVGQLVVAKMSGFEGTSGDRQPGSGNDGAGSEPSSLPVLLAIFGKSLRPDQMGVLLNTLDANQKGLFMQIMGMARAAASSAEVPGPPSGGAR